MITTHHSDEKDSSPVERPEEVLNMSDTDDPSLRPKMLVDYVGQTEAKKQVEILVESAKKRQAVVDHILIHGFQGLRHPGRDHGRLQQGAAGKPARGTRP